MIFDCFLLHNEVELAELRMEYLDSIANYYVVTQSFETFSGKRKGMALTDPLPPSLQRFKHKIIFNAVPTWRGATVPFSGATPEGEDRFQREAHSRNAMVNMVNLLAHHGDTILMSDVDEIPNRDMVLQHMDTGSIAVAHHEKFYRYYLNTFTGNFYPCTIQTRWPLVMTPQDMRNMRFQLPAIYGGWHFSTLYDTSEKLSAFSHAEYDTPHWHERIKENKAALREPFDRGGETYTVETIDDSFPDPVWKNQDKYQEWVYK